MKRKVIGSFLFALTFISLLLIAPILAVDKNIAPKSKGMIKLRDFAAEDSTGASVVTAITSYLSAATANGPDTTYLCVKVPKGAVAARVYFAGTSTENDTFSVALVGCAGDSGPRLPIGYVDGTLGTAAHNVQYGTAIANGVYADTLTVTNYWPTGIDLGTTNALNFIQTIVFDPSDLTYIWCIVYLANGASEAGQADTVGAYISFTFNDE